MFSLDPDTKVIIDTTPDGRFTFTVKFNGEMHPRSRPMANREDAELLGNLLLEHLEKTTRKRGYTDSFQASSPTRLF